MRLAEICVKHPVFATMLTAFLFVIGIVSMRGLGVDLYPKVDFPTITVTLLLPGSGPEEMESQVTKPVEEVLNTINGIQELQSSTIEGVARVFVTFVLERDVEQAAQDVREKISTVLADLPPDIQPPIVEKFDPDSSPIMSITVSSSTRSLREITELSDKRIKQRLETVNGVGQVLMLGGRRRQINIILDAKKMQALGVTIDQVKTALQRENVETPGGKVEQGKSDLSLRVLGPSQIDRYNRRRQLKVYCNLETWKPLESATRDVNAIIDQMSLLPGYDRQMSGRARRLEETVEAFALAFLLSLVFMYMILASQFDSFIHPVTIMTSIPLSIPFALISLMLTQRTLNIRTALGILLLFGIVKKNGILQIDYTNTLRARGMERDKAIIDANHARLRPILMTTISIIAGLIPAALSKGPGSAQNSGIAIAVIGGQTMCLLITLLLTPVAYSVFDDVAQTHVFQRFGVGVSIQKLRQRITSWSSSLFQ
jgi:multidrug efflux pump subunit AcrB